MSLLVFLLIGLTQPSEAIPFEPPFQLAGRADTSNATTSVGDIPQPDSSMNSWWQPSRSGRGTFDLLSSCLATLLLVAWTAYHPNIPWKTSGFQLLYARLQWLLITMFVPELVLWRSCQQWWVARRLVREINNVCAAAKDEAKEENGGRHGRMQVSCAVEMATIHTNTGTSVSSEHSGSSAAPAPSPDVCKPRTTMQPWTMKQAFFVVSGGFAVRASSFYPQPNVIFTPKGVLHLARAGILPDLLVDQIEDKSKADGLTKLLACWQAIWFIIQCVSRLLQGLPLCLLEIHTLIHVFCVFGMFGIWFDKGYNIGRPLFVDDARVVDMAAFFASDSKPVRKPDPKRRLPQLADNRCMGEGLHCTHESSLAVKTIELAHLRSSRLPGTPFREPKDSPISPEKVVEHRKRANRAIALLESENIHIPWSYQDDCLSFEEGPFVTRWTSNWVQPGSLDEADLWSNKYIVYPDPDNAHISAYNNRRFHGRRGPAPPLRPRFSGKLEWAARGHKLLAVSVIAFNLAYGGAHLVTWSFQFPTVWEMWTWRACTLLLMGAPTLAAFILPIQFMHQRFHHQEPSFPKPWVIPRLTVADMIIPFFSNGSMWAHMGTVYSLYALYVPARVFILGECFASLREVVPALYETVIWSQYLPHFS